jgi:pyrroline-5-carboxylate reductase
MGSALLSGFIKAALFQAHDVLVSDPRVEATADLLEHIPVGIVASNRDVVQPGGTVLLAVKPAQVTAVLDEISQTLNQDNLLLSIAGGVSLEILEEHLPPGVPVIRVMPNLPVMVDAGVSALTPGKWANSQHLAEAEILFRAVGHAVVVPEHNMDAVTGLSGSGPAYMAIIIEALADGGVKMGLTRRTAMELALQTMIGTAAMLQETGMHPGEFKDRVSSPGGTTITGLHVLENGGLRGLLISAVEAAARKTREL